MYSVPLVQRQCLSDLQSLHSRMKMHQFKLIDLFSPAKHTHSSAAINEPLGLDSALTICQALAHSLG